MYIWLNICLILTNIYFFISAALEILEEGVKPDIVLVCCGGGGLVSGIASAIKLSGLTDCKIYAVEPIGCKYIEDCHYFQFLNRGCRGRDRIVVGFTTICAISAYHH
jgi:cysteine synthase